MILTPHEVEAFDLLVKAHNKYLELPMEHISDQQEWTAAIHVLQRMILCRSGRRQVNASAVLSSENARHYHRGVVQQGPTKAPVVEGLDPASGEDKTIATTFDAEGAFVHITCTKCNGTGRMHGDEGPSVRSPLCPRCAGRGWLKDF